LLVRTHPQQIIRFRRWREGGPKIDRGHREMTCSRQNNPPATLPGRKSPFQNAMEKAKNSTV
jgi:hypothetical protein